MIQAADRANVIGVVSPRQIDRANGQELIANARALILAARVFQTKSAGTSSSTSVPNMHRTPIVPIQATCMSTMTE